MSRNTVIGIGLTLTTDFLLGLSIICGKLTTSVNPFVFLVIRNVLTFCIVLPKVIQSRTSFYGQRGERWSILFNAASFGVTSILIFVSIVYIPTGDATAIFSNYPVLGIFISKIFYKTKVSIVEVLCALASFVGVVFIAKPRFIFAELTKEPEDLNDKYWLGALCAFCCLITYAIGTTATQGIKRTPSTIPVLHNSIYTAVLSYLLHLATVSATIETVRCGWQPWFVLSSSILFSASLSIFQLAVTFERITTLLPVRSLGVVIAYVLQVLILNVYPTWNSYVGATIIIASVMTVSIRRLRRENKRANRMAEELKKDEKNGQNLELTIPLSNNNH